MISEIQKIQKTENRKKQNTKPFLFIRECGMSKPKKIESMTSSGLKKLKANFRNILMSPPACPHCSLPPQTQKRSNALVT